VRRGDETGIVTYRRVSVSPPSMWGQPIESQRQFRRADVIAKVDCARLLPGYRAGRRGDWCRVWSVSKVTSSAMERSVRGEIEARRIGQVASSGLRFDYGKRLPPKGRSRRTALHEDLEAQFQKVRMGGGRCVRIDGFLCPAI
jgi:hypothetical protein